MKRIDVYNPATGDLLASLSVDSAEAVQEKLKKGHDALRAWRDTSAYECSALLLK